MSGRSGNNSSTTGLPCRRHDDRIVSLGLHHTIDTGIAHDVIIDAWWTSL